MTFRSVAIRYSVDVGSMIRDLDKAAKANDQLAGRSGAAGKAMDVAAGAAVGLTLAMGVGVAKFAEFDAQMSAVAAASGATGKQLDSLREAALQAGADTKFSATEAAAGVTELAKAGVDAADILGGGLNGALSLAAAGQLDVASASEIAASAMTQFGLKGSDVGHIADLLAAGANKAQGSVGDLGAALNQTGLIAAQTGLSIEETTGGLAAFASAGMTGSDAGTSFKTMLQRLTAPSGEAAELMAELGINAFDANGQFVGLAEVAGQLEQGMGKLSPAMRSQAMATIFGADAARAAGVLYEQGAAGIAEWTEKVNEQGAAAETAAKLMDNLKGDMETLSGSVETVFIQAGSGANDMLREGVQTATDFVNAIGKIPGPVLLVGTGLAALALGLPKGISMWKGYKRSLDDAGLSFDKIAVKSPKAARGIQLVGRAAGTLAVAATAVYAFGDAADSLNVDKLSADLAGASDGLALINRELAAATDNGWGRVGSDIDSIGKALGATFDPGLMNNVDHAIGGFKTIFGGENVSNIANATKQLQGIDQALTQLVQGGNGAQAAEVFSQITRIAEEQGVTVEELQRKFPQYAAALAAVGPAGVTAASGTDEAATATEELEQKAQDAEDALEGLKTALEILGGGALAVRAATREMAEAMDAATESNTKAWKEGKTAAEIARGQQAALDGIATSTDAVMQAQMDNQASTAELTATYEAGRKKILEVLAARGIHGKAAEDEADKIMGTRGEMKKLIDTYGLTPKKVTTDVVANTAPALAAIRGLQKALVGIPDERVNIVVGLVTRGNRWADELADAKNSAAGNVVYAYAGGGYNMAGDVPNGHVPAIYTGSRTIRAFAEPETRGEAYTPLANDWRRPRAKAITEQVVSKFGGRVEWYAGGGLRGLAVGQGGSRMAGLDVATLARAIADVIPPSVTVVSGEDARTAAVSAAREFMHRKDRS